MAVRQSCVDAGMTICEPDLAEFEQATEKLRDTPGVKMWGEEGYAVVREIAEKK